MEIVLFFVLIYAAKRGWDDAWEAWRKSRSAYKTRADRNHPNMPKGKRARHALRHDVGYGLSQVRHGFPQARHGFAAGWHQGRQAHAQARAGRERAKAEHLETRAALLPEIREYLRRQREAQQQIRRQDSGEGSEGSPEGSPEGSSPDGPAAYGYCPYCGTRDDKPCPPECATWTLRGTPYPGREDDPTYSYGPESAALGWPSATREHAEAQAQSMSGDGDPWVVTEYPPGGGPGRTVATYRSGEEVRPAADGTPAPGADGTPEQQESAQPDTEGNDDMSDTSGDTTYTQQMRELTAIREDAEQEVNSVRRKRMMNRLDILSGLGLDKDSLSEAAAIDDALREQEKAAQQTLDASDAAINGLKQRHGGIQEAVSASPVDRPAEPGFYED